MYHTLIDDMEHLENGSIQHMGDNLLALLNEISASKILEQPETRDIGAFFEIFGIIHRKYRLFTYLYRMVPGTDSAKHYSNKRIRFIRNFRGRVHLESLQEANRVVQYS